MSLQVWLPLNGDLENKGLANLNLIATPIYSDNGKIGSKCLSSQVGWFQIPEMTGAKQMTFAYWVRLNEVTDTNWLDTFSWYTTNGTSSQRSRQEFYYNTGTSMTTGVWYYNQSNSGFAGIEVGEWNHFAFTIDYENGISKFYKNGSLLKTTTNVDTNYYVAGNNFLIRESALNTSINDFRLYDNVLSEKEIKQLSQGLMLHLPLNNNGTILNWTEIGNLLPNSKTMGLGSANVSEGIWRVAGSTTMTKSRVLIKDSPIGECYGFQNSGIQTSNDGSCYGIDSTTYFEPNTEYKISMFARITSGADGYAGYNIYSIGEELGGSHTAIQKNYRTTPLNADGSWTYCWYHFKTNSSETRNIYIGIVTGDVDVTTQMCLVRIDKWNDIMDSTIEYDSSGYGNNAVKNNITYAPDSPKYNVSSVFNGSNSYVKVSDNYWMADGMPEMTINLWAKATTWPTNGGRLLSCTESGGFNLEAGNTGYWKFPVCVYTNEGKTSYAYKYDSNEIKIADLIPDDWNMITLIYDKTGTKTYLNGVLNHTYTNTSYGIKFNTNARLFLGCEAATANPSTPYFNGKESDFRIYATALSEKDILSLYNNNAYIDSDGKIYGKIR